MFVGTDDTLPRKWSGIGRKPGENWFARRSQHSNHYRDGEMRYTDIDSAVREDHARHEQEYTPEVYDCFKVCDWDEFIAKEEGKNGVFSAADDGRYTNISMSLREMCHQMPFPLYPRVFPVLVVTARGPTDKSSIVAQIPVDISKLPGALYSNGRNVKQASKRSPR